MYSARQRPSQFTQVMLTLTPFERSQYHCAGRNFVTMTEEMHSFLE